MGNLESQNTVSSKNQVDKKIRFEGAINGTPKIMFVGNSITFHSPAPQIGWYGNWGMAASSKENDYVHLCIQHILEKYHSASFCIVQAADWERTYKEYDIVKEFNAIKGFNPDIIVTRLTENIPDDYLETNSFVSKLNEFHDFLRGENKDAQIVVTSNVFNNLVKDEAIKAYCDNFAATYVYINDLSKNKEYHANEYEHKGIRIHPGDKGMKMISDRILEVIDKMI